MDERIRRHERRAAMARSVALAATRLADFHAGIAHQMKKLPGTSDEGRTGRSRIREGDAGPSPARVSADAESH